jgi:hypothetical protein
MQVVFEPPDKDSPGFLRRMKQAIAFQDAINKNQLSEKVLDDMIGFLSAYVRVPEDREEARDLLLDASESQFTEMLQSITGNTEQPDDTKKNENGLGSGSKVGQKIPQ